MAAEQCNLCQKFGFTCRKGNWLERFTGREKIVVVKDTGQQFAHNFPIETCEVVTKEVPVEEYAPKLMEYIKARNSGLVS
jgi:hypothetical protein